MDLVTYRKLNFGMLDLKLWVRYFARSIPNFVISKNFEFIDANKCLRFLFVL